MLDIDVLGMQSSADQMIMICGALLRMHMYLWVACTAVQYESHCAIQILP